MNKDEMDKLAKEGVEEMIKVAQFYGIDYFKLGEGTQKLLQETYISGLRKGATVMSEAFKEAKLNYESPNKTDF